MSLEIQGRLAQKLQQESGVSKAGKQWSKQGFVVQLEGKYPRDLQIDVFNNTEMTTFINDTSIGTVLKCNINIDSKEFNGKWYHNVTLWKAEVVRGEENVPEPIAQNPPNQIDGTGDDSDMPF